MLRYLRIAVTALSITVCLLLVALWVRSYYFADVVVGRLTSTRSFNMASIQSELGLAVFPDTNIKKLEHYSRVSKSDERYFAHPRMCSRWGFKYTTDALGRLLVVVPHWCFVLLTGALAAITWLPWSKRFSLRTLLIAMTLVAVVLGAVIYAIK